MQYQKGNWKYRLLEPASYDTGIPIAESADSKFIQMTKDGLIVIQAGYCWDGPSGPTIDTKNFMRGSLFHDAAYQLMRESLVSLDYLPAFDMMLVRICKEDGMWALRRRWVYRGVRIGGGPAAAPRKVKILEAP